MMNLRYLFLAGWVLGAFCQGQQVFINEIHYDNSGSDVDEFVEILAPAGTDLSRYGLAFYNGANGQVYRALELSGVVPPSTTAPGVGAVAFPVPGIQNGAPDGIALIDAVSDQVIEFLSYEGIFIASGGLANGLESRDIGVFESSSVAAGQSLQRQGSGRTREDFEWAAPAVASSGELNAGQTFVGEAEPILLAQVTPPSLAETAGPSAVTLTLQLVPPPEEPVPLDLSSADGRVVVPERVSVPVDGVLSLAVDIVDNGVVDESALARVTVSDPSGVRSGVTVSLTLIDDDRLSLPFEGDLRVATFNVRNGVGASNSPGFEAIKAILARVNPDVIAFQETSSVDRFRQLKALLGQLGFFTESTYLATSGDGFSFAENGQFTSDQHVAIASRYPIKRTVQIGRGVAGRRELTRYPLFVEIDLPETDHDPAFVAVHLKAGRTQADQFRKRVEAYRVIAFLQDEGFDGRDDPVVVLGDFNENREASTFQTARFSFPPRFTDGSTLPVSYQLGSELEDSGQSLPYRTFPDRAFQGFGLRRVDAFHVNGRNTGTFISEMTGEDAPLDYIFVSQAIYQNGTPLAEVVNARFDAFADGLPKPGLAIEPGTDAIASDHRLVYADLALFPRPDVEVLVDDAQTVLEGGPAVAGRIQLAMALTEPLIGSLTSSRPELLEVVPSQWEIPAGTLELPITLRPLADGVSRADRRVSMLAEVDNRLVGIGALMVRNVEASGTAVISQYREPAGGMRGRAIELYHAGEEVIRFARQPLVLRRYAEGSLEPVVETRVETGLWHPGAVLVIGDTGTREALASNGYLDEVASMDDRGSDGVLFQSGDGAVRFVLDNLGFNGDDALEVQLGFQRSDVFGRIGVDPGEAWSGGDVVTQNSHLERHPMVPFGISGFDDPSGTFRLAIAGGLSGLGEPPLLDESYRQWVESVSLPRRFWNLDADPDRDGLSNFEEFAFQLDPNKRSVIPFGWEGENLRLAAESPLPIVVEMSEDLQSWTAIRLELPFAPVGEQPQIYFRVRVQAP